MYPEQEGGVRRRDGEEGLGRSAQKPEPQALSVREWDCDARETEALTGVTPEWQGPAWLVMPLLDGVWELDHRAAGQGAREAAI